MASDNPAPKKKVAKKKVAKKKVAKKKVIRKKVAKKAAASSKSSATAPAPSGKRVISAVERQEMIGRAAYFISMRRNPCEGSMQGDWVAAEAVIDMLFEVK